MRQLCLQGTQIPAAQGQVLQEVARAVLEIRVDGGQVNVRFGQALLQLALYGFQFGDQCSRRVG